MKNANAPAMPCEAEISNNNEAWAFQFDNGAKFKFPGITKREMFAMNAPQCPACFEREWSQNNYDNKDYFNTYVDEFAEHCPTTYSEILPKGKMALIKAWRYAYADLMLED